MQLSKTIFPFIFIVSILLGGCTLAKTSLPADIPDLTENPVTIPGLPLTIITFVVDIPISPTPINIYLDVVDDLTGPSMNTARYEMSQVNQTRYKFDLPVPAGSVIKYRYTANLGEIKTEHQTSGKPVRYRLYAVMSPGTAMDIVSSWDPNTIDGNLGAINGIITDFETNQPVPGIYVTGGGSGTYTLADGTYKLNQVPAGTQNIVALSVDGKYNTFQQGAVVATGFITEAPIKLTPVKYSNIKFTVSPPEDAPKGIPIRMIGNLYSMGLFISDLQGGLSTVASRSPLLIYDQNGTYSITLSLPVGYDFRYKYSLGDGFWNAEHKLAGNFHTRQMIVPSGNNQVYDDIETWKFGSMAPITFTVQAPTNTPASDTVSIQFHMDMMGWTVPIPMWSLGDNRWMYILYSPLPAAENIGYRYCRNDQCGFADDNATIGVETNGYSIKPGISPQEIKDNINQWVWLPAEQPSVQVVASDIVLREAGFMAGVEYLPMYTPTWQAYEPWSLQYVKSIGSNWVVLSPTWTQDGNTLYIEPGKDQSWLDLVQITQMVEQNGMNSAIYPRIQFTGQNNYSLADEVWWKEWWSNYRVFVLHHASTAARTNDSALVLEDPRQKLDIDTDALSWITDQDWIQLINDVRQIYTGMILWEVDYPSDLNDQPNIINHVDAVYLVWSAPLTDKMNPTIQELTDEFNRLLDEEIEPFYQKFQKQVILVLNYQSIDGSASSCIEWNNSCWELTKPIEPSQDIPQINLDLQEQADIYNAALLAINNRQWINGFISSGYYPPAILQDKSSSIHGKPSGDVIWYWYHKMLSSK